MRERTRTTVGAVAAVTLLTACGAARDEHVVGGGGATGGPSFGVDSGAWPGDLAGAESLLRALPETVAGEPRSLHLPPPGEEVSSVAATFGDRGSVTVLDDSQTGSAYGSLAAGFGLVYACAEGTYSGTAPGPGQYGGGPEITSTPPPGSVWFTCSVDGAEGDPGSRGRVVGWTSERTGWMVVAEDDETARAIIDAARGAAG